MTWTRRDFTKMVISTPAMAGLENLIGFGLKNSVHVLDPSNRSIIQGVQFGVQPFCYHDLVMNRENRPELLRRIVKNGFGMVELHATWCEPNFNAPGVSPAEARKKIHDWRLSTPPEYYEAIRKEFDDAGVSIFTYYVNMNISYQNHWIDYTDEEVDATFSAAKILGARGCIGSQGLKATERLATFTDKYDMFIGVHNHSNLSDPDALNNEDSFVEAFSYSPNVMATFDTRHYTAANGDCIAWPIVVLLEFEHGTLRTGLEETQMMFDYCKRALS
jgi:sugar phosphate isomerase/epimerase